MKKTLKTLILALAVLLPVAASAASSAPVKHSVAAQENKAILKQQAAPKPYKPEAKMEVAQMRLPGMPVVKSPLRDENKEVWYQRPAGAFTGNFVVEDGSYSGMFYAPYLLIKPYTDYTFIGHTVGVSDNATFEWDVQHWDSDSDEQVWTTVTDAGKNLTWKWGYELNDAPWFNVFDGGDWLSWSMKGFYMTGTGDNPVQQEEHPAQIAAVPNTMDIWDIDILVSSKNFCYGGHYGNQRYPMTYYSGAEPYGNNDNGWWFGKNGGITNGSRIDGIAQAFEKPTAPYRLNQVVMYCGFLDVASPVNMTCKVYKLDEIPAYDNETPVMLPEVPGELIVEGVATVTPNTEAETGGLVFFTLYGRDELDPDLVYEYNPTIDYPILVVVDGYNDPEMANLTDFTTMVSTDDHVDEGFGELAYLKFGLVDEDGQFDHYEWLGLNNFFSSGTMMTGFTIFLSIENPFIVFNYADENGEYLFPNEGGELVKHFGDGITSNGIEFFSSEPSEDENWYVLDVTNGSVSDEVPDWLHITLTDQYDSGEFTGSVNAQVTADPLPVDFVYREEVVRFFVPGAYVDYKFMQGDNTPMTFDFEVDGIYYKKLDSSTAAVTCKNSDFNSYKGVVVIPETVSYQGVNYAVTQIGNHAFRNCADLISVSVPCSITSISENAFFGCNALHNLIITGDNWQAGNFPKIVDQLIVKNNVQSIHGLGAYPAAIFSYNPVPPECDENTFTGYVASLQVPKSALVSYFTAPYWSNFAELTNNAVEPTAVTISQDTVMLSLDDEMPLTATVTPANATPRDIVWVSTDNAVAGIDNDVVIPIAEGECDILACCADRMAVCHVIVGDVHPESILLSENNITLEIGSQHTLTATVLPEDAIYESINWSTSDSDVASVVNGTVTAIGQGECDITATCRDKQAVCHVKVLQHIIHITLDQHQVRMQPNQMLTLTPTMTPESTDLAVTSSNPSVAVARIAAGKVQVVSVDVGTAVITVGSVDGNAVPDSCVVIVYGDVGDVNGDGIIGIADVTTLIDYLLTRDESLIDMDAADVNSDGLVDIADVTSLIDYMLNGTWPWETIARPKPKHVIDISPATVRDFINKSASL